MSKTLFGNQLMICCTSDPIVLYIVKVSLRQPNGNCGEACTDNDPHGVATTPLRLVMAGKTALESFRC